MTTRIVFFVTEDWYFASHRLPLALEAQRRGWEVHVLTRLNTGSPPLAEMGFHVHNIHIARSGLNPLEDLRTLRDILRIYREVRPHIVHHVAMKPVLYGSLAARVMRPQPAVVNALAGLGFVFSSQSPKARTLKPLVKALLRKSLSGSRSRTIVQNPDDARTLTQIQGTGQFIRLIRGSGVDTSQFIPKHSDAGTDTDTMNKPVVFGLSARLNEDKGVSRFVEAAGIVRGIVEPAPRFVLIGQPDEHNPSAVPQEALDAWAQEGLVELWGHRTNMPETLQGIDVAVLPSTYGEGLPKALLEAGSCGLPIITTDTPGCRETVVDGVTGFIVPPGDSEALATAVRRLAEDHALRQTMGAASRRHVAANFAVERVVSDTFSVYAEVIPSRPHPGL
ncbi:glycosyltransferase family 4 protein [Ornithinimicrobium humiphilum]|uniref:Glycosyltransferase involved in cell wall biosynthesis n=1 Tax=Ornithinimicrobium humiphilum TaxID=125288 RepID=A0A543K880_9MICO|nr:glycosyltransferase family 4 protein [Ornithinimicrobium humiphilum]TQM91267.1 glycosyltransferase involved in cell wall biosynthesis [Ornithinimicrobium humiphilum]